MQFAQIFSFLMALSGFGVDADPKAPTGDQVLQHAVEDADLVVHVDVAAVVPRNFKALTDLPTAPSIKGNPDLVKMTKELAGEAAQARATLKGVTGIDLVTDVSSLTVFVKFTPTGEPSGLVEVRGNLPADLVSKLSKTLGAPMETFGGRTGLALPEHHYLGMTKDGALLVGTEAEVKARLADAWKAPARAAGSKLARLAALLDEKPFVLYAVAPSANLVKLASKGGKNALIDMLKDWDLMVGSLRADGLTEAMYLKSSKGYDNAVLAMDGSVDLMRAFQIAPRGLAKVFVAYLDSYAGTSKEIDELIKHKDELLKLVMQFTGDGQFKAELAKDPKARSVVLHATAGKLSEVLPLGMIVPLGAIGYLTMARVGGAEPATLATPAVVATPPAKASTGGPAKIDRPKAAPPKKP